METKTPRDFIKAIPVNKANLQHIAETGVINGSLLVDIEYAIKDYATQETKPLQERIDELEEERASLIEKHSEELANYNSYAAYDMENRHDKAMGDLITKIEDQRNLAKDMMGELANPVIVAYDWVISRIKMINLDNF